MAVGANAAISPLSYLATGRETAFGTLVTATSNLDFLSASMKTSKEVKVHEEVSNSRTFARHLRMGKSIEGEAEFYFYPQIAACNHILGQAMGGTITSSTSTGETASGLGFQHIYSTGNHDQSYTSLSINMRKGDSTNGKIFEYPGVKVNEIAFSAEIDDALKCSIGLIAKDSTQTSNDYSSSHSDNTTACLSFVNGRFSAETTFASLTSTSFWHVQSMNLSISNSFKADAESRRIGSDTLEVLPPGILAFELSTTIRFDTTTAYDAMINDTSYGVELEFLGGTMAGSVIREGIKFQLPKCYINDAGEPEIGGPDEVLQSEVTWTVLQDVSSATGYAFRAIVNNLAASYA